VKVPIANPPPPLQGDVISPIKKQGMAITSLVLGILSLFCGFLFGIPAIILGHIARSRARNTPGQYMGAGKAVAGLTMGYVSILAAFLLIPLAYSKYLDRVDAIQCENHMKMIGLALRVWAGDNQDAFPFNVNSKNGGSREKCKPDADGYDKNSALHFQVMSNELVSTEVLVCPSDKRKLPALNFSHLEPANVTYQLRVGKNVNDKNPSEVLLHCPIHGNVILCDGSFVRSARGKEGTPKGGVPGGEPFTGLPPDLEEAFHIDDSSYEKSQIAALDDSLFAKARATSTFSFICTVENDDFLQLLSNSRNSTIAKVARLRLSLQDPLIKQRCGNLQLVCEWQSRSADYQSTRPRKDTAEGRASDNNFPGSEEPYGKPFPILGEFVSLAIERNGIVIANGAWETEFPSRPWGIGFICARIDTSPLLVRVLKGNLRDDEIRLILESKRPELRQAAVLLMDTRQAQAILNEIALKDPEEFVRMEATKRVTDQSVLARIAIDNSSLRERVEEALGRLTNQASLAWVALNCDHAYPVSEVIEKLTDPELLAKVAIEMDGRLPESYAEGALRKLTDKTLIRRVESDAKLAGVREEASRMLAR